MSSVKVESVNTSGWLLDATFNDAAIIHELELHDYDIDAIQNVDKTCNEFDEAIFEYCSTLKAIMSGLLGDAKYRGEEAEDDMLEAWSVLIEVVNRLNEPYSCGEE